MHEDAEHRENFLASAASPAEKTAKKLSTKTVHNFVNKRSE
jgi:hypothetical protein